MVCIMKWHMGAILRRRKKELIPLESSALNIIEFDLIFHIDIFHGAMVDWASYQLKWNQMKVPLIFYSLAA